MCFEVSTNLAKQCVELYLELLVVVPVFGHDLIMNIKYLNVEPSLRTSNSTYLEGVNERDQHVGRLLKRPEYAYGFACKQLEPSPSFMLDALISEGQYRRLWADVDTCWLHSWDSEHRRNIGRDGWRWYDRASHNRGAFAFDRFRFRVTSLRSIRG